MFDCIRAAVNREKKHHRGQAPVVRFRARRPGEAA